MKTAVLWLAVALCLTIVSPLHAFQRETTDDDECEEAPGVNCKGRGTPLVWRTVPVGYFVNSDASGLAFADVRDAVRSAFSIWQTASKNNITFAFGGQSHSGSDGQDGQNLVRFVHLGNSASDTFAQSILTYDSRTGEIFDVDIELNADEPFAILPDGEFNPFNPDVDVQAVVTHEVGHVLGLAHENRFGSAVVMFFSDTSGNTTHRQLTSDDRSGVRAIYPKAVDLSDGGTSTGGADGEGGGGGGGCTLDPSAERTALWPTLLLLGGLAFRRKKRGRTTFRTTGG